MLVSASASWKLTSAARTVVTLSQLAQFAIMVMSMYQTSVTAAAAAAALYKVLHSCSYCVVVVVDVMATTSTTVQEQLSIAEAGCRHPDGRLIAEQRQLSSVSARSNYRRYFKIAVLVITLVLVLASSTVPLFTKLQVADSLGNTLAQQWQSLAQRSSSISENYTMTAAAAEHTAA